jgi:hypothetical protein
MDKVNMGKARATALKEYSMNPVAQELMPFNLFCEFFLNMGKTEIDRTMDENDNTVKVEAPVTDDENATLRGEDKDKDSKKVRGEGDLQYGRQKTS